MLPVQVTLSRRIRCMCCRRLIRSCPPKLRKELTICLTMIPLLKVECTNTMHLKDKTHYVGLLVEIILTVRNILRRYLTVVAKWGGAPTKTKKRRHPKNLVESCGVSQKGPNNLLKQDPITL